MKPTTVFFIILVFYLFKCTPDNPRLTHYKIEDFYVGVYKLNNDDSTRNLSESNFFSKGDSVFIGLSFKISYCDSTMKVCKYGWQPTRGGYGIANKIKKFFILSKIEKGYDTISMLDLKLVRDSLNYIVKKGNGIEGRANSVSRPGCRTPFDEFIKNVNAGHICYHDNSLNGANLLYFLNTQKLSNGNNELELCFEFEDYALKRKIAIRFE